MSACGIGKSRLSGQHIELQDPEPPAIDRLYKHPALHYSKHRLIVQFTTRQKCTVLIRVLRDGDETVSSSQGQVVRAVLVKFRKPYVGLGAR
ncbi:hypothetical protein PG997_006700 [Apiospora hydei]|uniref:Uncharacterized protein n=1 Tax=Apiospora hydei TaxID=1337664 RepID=A0ABR1WS21_9PEZI